MNVSWKANLAVGAVLAAAGIGGLAMPAHADTDPAGVTAEAEPQDLKDDSGSLKTGDRYIDAHFHFFTTIE